MTVGSESCLCNNSKKTGWNCRCLTVTVSAIVVYNANVRLIQACKNIIFCLLEEGCRGPELTIFNWVGWTFQENFLVPVSTFLPLTFFNYTEKSWRNTPGNDLVFNRVSKWSFRLLSPVGESNGKHCWREYLWTERWQNWRVSVSSVTLKMPLQ